MLVSCTPPCPYVDVDIADLIDCIEVNQYASQAGVPQQFDQTIDRAVNKFI